MDRRTMLRLFTGTAGAAVVGPSILRAEPRIVARERACDQVLEPPEPRPTNSLALLEAQLQVVVDEVSAQLDRYLYNVLPSHVHVVHAPRRWNAGRGDVVGLANVQGSAPTNVELSHRVESTFALGNAPLWLSAKPVRASSTSMAVTALGGAIYGCVVRGLACKVPPRRFVRAPDLINDEPIIEQYFRTRGLDGKLILPHRLQAGAIIVVCSRLPSPLSGCGAISAQAEGELCSLRATLSWSPESLTNMVTFDSLFGVS